MRGVTCHAPTAQDSLATSLNAVGEKVRALSNVYTTDIIVPIPPSLLPDKRECTLDSCTQSVAGLALEMYQPMVDPEGKIESVLCHTRVCVRLHLPSTSAARALQVCCDLSAQKKAEYKLY